jgi:hypothetical protein
MKYVDIHSLLTKRNGLLVALIAVTKCYVASTQVAKYFHDFDVRFAT